MVVGICEDTKKHLVVCLKRVNCLISELCLNRVFFYIFSYTKKMLVPSRLTLVVAMTLPDSVPGSSEHEIDAPSLHQKKSRTTEMWSHPGRAPSPPAQTQALTW